MFPPQNTRGFDRVKIPTTITLTNRQRYHKLLRIRHDVQLLDDAPDRIDCVRRKTGRLHVPARSLCGGGGGGCLAAVDATVAYDR